MANRIYGCVQIRRNTPSKLRSIVARSRVLIVSRLPLPSKPLTFNTVCR